MTLVMSREFVDEGELDVIEGVQRIEDADLLRVVEALAHERAMNIELFWSSDILTGNQTASKAAIAKSK